MNAREVLEIMIRTNRGNMTVWSPTEVRKALDAYRAEVLREAAEVGDRLIAVTEAGHLDHWTLTESKGIRALATELRTMADETAPDSTKATSPES